MNIFKLKYHEKCEKSIQCSAELPHTFCNTTAGKESICECTKDYHFKNEKCYRKIELGDWCNDPNECTASNSDCKDVCKCKPGHSANGNECVFGELGAKCKENGECGIPNSDCQKDKCTCKKNYYPTTDGKCVAGPFAECQSKDDCQTENSICDEKEHICKCADNHVPGFTGKCLPISSYNGTCEDDAQCSAGLEHTFCKTTGKSSVCECRDEFFYKEKNKKCELKKWVGQTCEEKDECFTPKTECDNKHCKCEAGLLAVNKQCVLNELGGNCLEERECPENSDCQKNKCACKKFYFELEKKCVAGLNAKCDKVDDCKFKEADCIKNKCQCNAKNVASPAEKDKCLPKLQYNDVCEQNVQCDVNVPKAVCKKGEKDSKCECPDKHHFKNNQCYESKVLNETCAVADECITEHSHCEKTVCQCLADHPLNADGKCGCSAIQPLFALMAVILLGLKTLF